MRQLKHYNQFGRGVFIGTRYQNGNGFFSRVIKNSIFPLLKYIGKQGIKTAVAIGEEAVKNPNSDLKTIVKSKLKDVGMEAIDDGAKRVKKFVQTGKGIKRKCEDIKGTKAKKPKVIMKVLASRTRKIVKPNRVPKVKRVKKSVKRLKSKKAIKGRKKKKQGYSFLKKNGSSTH